MNINCPHCKGGITVGPEHIGRSINCPHCQRPLKFSGDAAAVGAVDRQLPPTLKLCPACKGKVSKTAQSCPHCGEHFARQGVMGFLTEIIILFVALCCLPVATGMFGQVPGIIIWLLALIELTLIVRK